MPTTVTAKKGDTLCCLAMDAGFIDCAPLRALGQNADFLNRELKDGDQVVIPDLDVKESDKATDTVHTFTKKNSPPVSIRFVHGSPNIPYRQDTTTTVLHVSNFVTNLGGTDGRKPFPSGFGFNNDGHVDLDTFKIEVVDPKAGGSLNVKLEALQPVYKAEAGGKLSVTDRVPFTTADAASRRIDALECQRVSAGTAFCYRSRYMRLVTDEEDHNTLPTQTLLVTDNADGLGTGLPADNDSLEILDQEVRATYEIPRCPGNPKCKVTAQLPIGEARKRIRVAMHVYRKTVGSATLVGDIDETTMKKNLRRRLFKWFRRTYAQADMGCKLVDPLIEILDPPAQNYLAIAMGDANFSPAGTTLNFTLHTDAGDTPVSFPVPAGKSPFAVATALAAALPAGFKGDARKNARPLHAAQETADIIITANDGKRVTIQTPGQLVSPPSAAWRARVARVVLNNVEADIDAENWAGAPTPEFRAIMRSSASKDSRLDCYIVTQLSNSNTRGQAFSVSIGTNAEFNPPEDIRNTTVMAIDSSSGKVLDGGNNLPFTWPHEGAHVLLDIQHTTFDSAQPNKFPNATNQLLSGQGTSVANAVDATKRLCDAVPTPVHYHNLNGNGTAGTDTVTNAVKRLRDKGSSMQEDW